MNDQALAAHSISFSYSPAPGGAPTLRDLSAAFPAGAFTAIIGPNGAGKSTLLRVLLGVLGPFRGRVTLADRPLAEHTRHERARRIAYVPQRASVAFAFSARAVVALGRFASDSAEHHRGVDRALAAVDMLALADMPLGNLSVGQQQRVAVARALANRPELVLADEPTGNLDQRAAADALALIRDICRESGAALLMVSHDPRVLDSFENRLELHEINRAAATATSGGGA